MTVTRKTAGVVSLLMLTVFCGFELYHQTGIVHATRKNGYGCLCHGFEPSDSVRVWIVGPDSLRPGEQATYFINIARRPNIAAGFNVAAYRGSLGIVDSVWTQLLTESPGIDSLELTHTWPRPGNGRDTISWVFSYKAPLTVGFIDTLYAAGNSVNLDTLPDPPGDAWNYSPNFTVRVVPPTSVEEANAPLAFRLFQNYPNPFSAAGGNSTTRIAYSIQGAGFVSLKVFDMLGREVATLVDGFLREESFGQGSGFKVVEFDGTGLPSGIYIYRLKFGDVVLARKMVLLR